MKTIEQAIKTITDFTRSQMDGQQVPPAESAEMQELSTAIRALLTGSTSDQELLATHMLGLVIDRVRGALGMQGALHNLTQGGPL
ncbi:hypothetical protein [Hydrogenophaga sp. T2]|uniref:hypothetical protein n=1 Tax=Hydrogenophaga sp. T2 TaxID=3132823 RepID=UPI003CEEA27C